MTEKKIKMEKMMKIKNKNEKNDGKKIRKKNGKN